MDKAGEEHYLTLAEVAARCGVAKQTVRSWATVGIRVRRGHPMVRLRAEMHQGVHLVSVENLDAFLAATRKAALAGDEKGG